MKLSPPATFVFRFSPLTAAHSSPSHGRSLSAITKTLSPTTKKPASLAGFLFLLTSNTPLTPAFFSPALCALNSPAPNLIIQTPNNS